MTARDKIFQNLQMEAIGEFIPQENAPELKELSLSRSQLVTQFITLLEAQTAEVFRAKDKTTAIEALAKILHEENIQYAMTSSDADIASLDLARWARSSGRILKTRHDFPNRESYKKAVFTRADAGITGVDYGIAESGTLVLIHNQDQPRLISLAPVIHIAFMPVEKIVPVLESVIEDIKKAEYMPSHITFITGPSMTSDIQGKSFKGMHGPRKLKVIVIGDI